MIRLILIALLQNFVPAMAQNYFMKELLPAGNGIQAITTSSNNFFIGGIQSDGFIAMYDNDTLLKWNTQLLRPMGGTIPQVILEYGDFIISGGSTIDTIFPTPVQNFREMYLCKIDISDGSIVNSFTAGELFDDGITDLVSDNSGNIYGIGSTNVQTFSPISSRGFIVKLDSTLSPIWYKTFERIGITVFESIEIDESNNLLISGYVKLNNTVNSELILMKTDTSGNAFFCKKYSVTGGILIGSKIKYRNANYFISGNYNEQTPALTYNKYLMITDSAGNILNSYYFSSTPFFSGGDFDVMQGGDLLIGGSNILLRTDSSGIIKSATDFLYPIQSIQTDSVDEVLYAFSSGVKFLYTDSVNFSCFSLPGSINRFGLNIIDSLITFSELYESLTLKGPVYGSQTASTDYTICNSITSISDLEFKNLVIELYPNPTDGIVHINVDNFAKGFKDKLNFTCINQYGAEVNLLFWDSAGRISADMSELRSGVYYLLIYSYDFSFRESIKIVKI